MNAKPIVLIVDDDEAIRTQMTWALTSDYEVLNAGDRTQAVAQFRRRQPAVILLDLGLPPQPADPTEGLATLADILALDPQARVVIVSGQGERETAQRAIGAGACDLLGKPVDLPTLRAVLSRCIHVGTLEREFRHLQTEQEPDRFEGMIGSSPGMQRVFAAIRRVAGTDAPVLITGESGTGKERVARAIHQLSSRRRAPFVAINASAIPETLLESELFGHEKGAFTGAAAQRRGRIELAHGGTLFLDEIGEVPAPVQVKLLRFLQERRLERVGGRTEIEVNARVVAATNADLRTGLRTGAFREDLFYRLAVVEIALPPLRERGEDLAGIATALTHQFATEQHRPGLVLGSDALHAIQLHAWPGNVRELQNRIRRAVIMCTGRRITPADLELNAAPNGASNLRAAREALERDLLEAALRKHGGSISAAAQDLGISRPTCYELMEKCGIPRPSRCG
jgi:two-component system NtrC family response regulator